MKRFLAALTALLCIAIFSRAENWVELSAANFEDKEFRNYLRANCKSSNTVFKDGWYKTVGNKEYIDADKFTEVNINYADGKKYDVTVNYQSIASLKGIQLLRAVETITLPNPSYWERAYALKSVDFSGMKYLKKVTNAATSTGGYPYKTDNSGTTVPSANTEFSMPMTSFVAENCTELREVRLSGYKSLQSISLKGSNNVVNLYVPKTGLRSLDISNLTNLFNEETTSSYIDQDFDEAMGMSGKPNDAMKLMVTFSLKGCSDLEYLNLGNVNIHYLDISGCTSLKELDLSGQTDLYILRGSLGTTSGNQASGGTGKNDYTNCKHVYKSGSNGVLNKVIFGTKRIIRSVHLKGGCLTDGSIDLKSIAGTVVDLDLSYNKFRSFDGSQFKKSLTTFNVSYNRIHNLIMPKYSKSTTMSISDNCLTNMPQYQKSSSVNALNSNLNPFQYIRVGKVRKFKILENPEDAQYFETADDTNSQKYFFAPSGGHLGDPTVDETDFDGNKTGVKEDPCFFYFNDDFKDGVYFYRNPYSKTAHFQHNWMKVVLCRAEAVDFNPAEQEFYLSGDFNNWQPGEKDKFIYDPDEGKYFINYNSGDYVFGHFRVWNGRTPQELSYNFGGHSSDFSKSEHKGKDGHVLFLTNVEHKMDTNHKMHYTTYSEASSDNGYHRPTVEMLLEPGSTSNYVAIRNNVMTGVEGIEIEEEGSDAPTQYYNLQGIPVSPDALVPGIYLRRQGNKTTKIAVR